jgi:hypothetical protein
MIGTQAVLLGDLANKAVQKRDLSEADFVYLWANGVHLKVRLDEAKACVLVMVGVRAHRPAIDHPHVMNALAASAKSTLRDPIAQRVERMYSSMVRKIVSGPPSHAGFGSGCPGAGWYTHQRLPHGSSIRASVSDP